MGLPSRCMRLEKIKQSSLIIGSALVAFSLLFLGIKLGTIFHFGNATPYWDQWDAEAANLYKPFLEGTLTSDLLLAPHCEHRILITRLLALFLLKINYLWNPLLQMVANAILHLIALLLTLALLSYIFGKKIIYPLLCFMLLLFSVPFGWENTLAGFQSQFYFVLIFSIGALFLLIDKKSFSWWWWVGIFFGFLAFFSLASGLFSLAAGAIILGMQFLPRRLGALRALAASILLGLFAFYCIAITPAVSIHIPLKAHSIHQFFGAFIPMMSWPLPGTASLSGGSLSGSIWFWFFFRNAPSVIFCVRFFFQRAPQNDRRWILLGLIIWSTIQIMSIAYGRAVGCMAPRYTDLFSFSLLFNFVCFFDTSLCKQEKIRLLALLLWATAVFCGGCFWGNNVCYPQLIEKRNYSTIEMLNVQRYQASNDIHDLQDKKFLEIPYPDPNRLALILSYPTIQRILPACIHRSSEDGTGIKGRYDAAIDVLLAHYFVLIEAGVLILLLLTLVVLFC